MTAVPAASSGFNIIKKFKKTRLTQRSNRKVSVIATSDVTADVSEQSNKDSVNDGFCGESFADKGELLSSLSPLLFSMKLFGLYFYREHRHRRRADDPEWNSASTTTGTTSTKLRVYAAIILIFVWFNFLRLVFLFNNSDHFGSRLLIKIVIFAWFGLIAILQAAYYYASHTRQLIKVLLTLPVTVDCVVKARRVARFLTANQWVVLVINGSISACFFFLTEGNYDFTLAPFVTYIKVPENKILLARIIGNLLHFLPIPCSLFAELMTLVLVYIFYIEFKKLKQNFRRAFGERGQFNGDLSVFRRRHQTLSRAVSKIDGFMKFSNVAGFVCHIANIIMLMYSVIFYPDSTSNSISAFIHLSTLLANVVGLLFSASAGIIVNHMVRISITRFETMIIKVKDRVGTPGVSGKSYLTSYMWIFVHFGG